MANRIPPNANLARRLVLTVAQYQGLMSRRLHDFGIGVSEYPVLIYLSKREEEGSTGHSQRDIARRQHRDPALINRATKSLAKKGLLSVSPDPRSGNRQVLQLTDEGRRVAAEVNGLVQSWEDAALAPLSPQERDQLNDLLSRLDVVPDDDAL